MSRKPVASRAGAESVVRAAGVWSGPIPYVSSVPPRVWLLGATGGAGVTTLERVLGFAADAGRRWPGAEHGQTTRVVIVARETAGSLAAAQRLLEQYAAGDTGAADLVGLITIAHRPDPMPERIARLRSDVAGAARSSWRVEWHGQWPQVETINLPVWGAVGDEGAGALGELPDDVVALAIDLANRVDAGQPPLDETAADHDKPGEPIEPTEEGGLLEEEPFDPLDVPAVGDRYPDGDGPSLVDDATGSPDAGAPVGTGIGRAGSPFDDRPTAAFATGPAAAAAGAPAPVGSGAGGAGVAGTGAAGGRAMPRVIDQAEATEPRPKRSGTIVAAIVAILLGALLGTVVGLWAAGVFERTDGSDQAIAPAAVIVDDAADEAPAA